MTAPAYGLRSAVLDQPTVFYETLWSANYVAAGLPVPANAKPTVDMTATSIWLDSLTSEQLDLVDKLAGSVIRAPVNRNAACPCGSGKRYKHCHGAITNWSPWMLHPCRELRGRGQGFAFADLASPFQPIWSTLALSTTRTFVALSLCAAAWRWPEDLDASFGQPTCTFEKRSVAKAVATAPLNATSS